MAFGWLDKMPFTDEDYGLIGGPQNGTQKGPAGSGVPGGDQESPSRGENEKKDAGQYWLKPGYQPNLPGMPPWSIWAEQRRKWHWSPQRARDEYNSIYKKHRFSIDQDKADWMEPLVLGVAGGRGLASRGKATKASQQQAREWHRRRQAAEESAKKHEGESAEALGKEYVDILWKRLWDPGLVKKTKGRSQIKYRTGGFEQAKNDYVTLPGRDITPYRERVEGLRIKRAPGGGTFAVRPFSSKRVAPRPDSNLRRRELREGPPTLERQMKVPPARRPRYRKLRYEE